MLSKVHARLLAIAAILVVPAQLTAQLDDEEFRPGLVGSYQAAGGPVVQRADARIAFAWGSTPPDRRLANGEFSVRWDGYLMSQAPGENTDSQPGLRATSRSASGERSCWTRSRLRISGSRQIPSYWNSIITR